MKNIGIIAKNQEEGTFVKRLLSNDDEYYILTKPYHPSGLMLDAVIETALAKENPHYDRILYYSEECLTRS